jgi:hypothetical protein
MAIGRGQNYLCPRAFMSTGAAMNVHGIVSRFEMHWAITIHL